MSLRTTKWCTLLLAAATAATAKWIVPGARWYDTEGGLVNAHAGCVTVDRESGKFFLFGEYKVEGQVEGGGISVYSSEDLATWEHHGMALEPIKGHQYISPEHIIQRPKVVYSEGTGKYHMWWHADNSTYGWLLQGFAQADNITGPYSFVDATRPLGNWSQDFGLFTDYKDGKSYALYSNGDRKEARDVYITSYNDDITALDKVVHRFDKYDLEAPTILQTDKSYFALMSHKTGYRPNNVVAFRADSLSGPWSQPFIVAPLNTRTYNSQSGYSLRINGTKKTTYLYLGDQWDSNSLWESRYIWLPISIDEEKKSLKVEWHDIYDLDIKTGEVTPITGTSYSSTLARTSGTTYHQEASFTSSGTIATSIAGNHSTLTFHNITGAGKPQYITLYYQNTDDMGFGDQPGGTPDRIGGTWQLRRIASVVVNGERGKAVSVYQRDTHKGIVLSATVKVELREGAGNTVEVGGLWNGFDVKAADVERLVVYPPQE
ncbi:carbohydrate-binding module family 35 protein [Periconia macrospinosa]|uniref:Carbohydrate-binding module family 35 protein n=1 Tax=Periconia macrospinosa TaxID=97972 RepID=A0A2V1E834_9PLEO|nr:carbohydrate-binding module family 35 protein [Periconia macrospinosa]